MTCLLLRYHILCYRLMHRRSKKLGHAVGLAVLAPRTFALVIAMIAFACTCLPSVVVNWFTELKALIDN